MDIYCQRCGEPYDTYDINDFTIREDGGKAEDFYTGQGCPSCHWGKDAPAKQPTTAMFSEMLSDVLGDDIDAIACELEDAEWMGMFEE